MNSFLLKAAILWIINTAKETQRQHLVTDFESHAIVNVYIMDESIYIYKNVFRNPSNTNDGAFLREKLTAFSW